MRHVPLAVLPLVVACDPPTTNAADLTEGTLDVARLPPEVVLEDELPATVSPEELDRAVEGLSTRVEDVAADVEAALAARDAAPRTAGAQVTDFDFFISLVDDLPRPLLTVEVPGSPSGAVSLVAHAYVEKPAAPTGRYRFELRRDDCEGDLVGVTMWRPPLAESGYVADTLHLTGSASGVTEPTTFVLCGFKRDEMAADATVYLRGLVAHW